MSTKLHSAAPDLTVNICKGKQFRCSYVQIFYLRNYQDCVTIFTKEQNFLILIPLQPDVIDLFMSLKFEANYQLLHFFINVCDLMLTVSRSFN